MFIVYDGCIMVPIEDAIYPKKGRKLPDVSLTAPAPVCLGAADVSLTALTLYGLSHLAIAGKSAAPGEIKILATEFITFMR